MNEGDGPWAITIGHTYPSTLFLKLLRSLRLLQMRAWFFLVLLPLSACGSTRAPAADTEAGRPAVLAAAPANDAEVAVQRAISRPGVHVVHFWAPWCDNSIAELQQGWYEVVENNPEVDFTFVTVWNDGGDGRDALTRYAIPDRVTVLTQPDGRAEALRRRTFLGLPMTWLPTTWIFHDGGQLAFAFNYGELTMPQLQAAIESAGRDW